MNRDDPRLSDYFPEPPHKRGIIKRILDLYRQVQRFRATEARRRIIDPNKDSDVKVEHYWLGLNAVLTLGQPCPIEIATPPDVSFRPQEFRCNIEEPGMVFIRDLRVSNVSGQIGGVTDAFSLNRMKVDLPTMSPANKVILQGEYTGKLPTRIRNRAMVAQMDHLIRAIAQVRTDLDTIRHEKTIKKARRMIDTMLDGLRPPLVNVEPAEKFTFCFTIAGPAGLVF